MCTLIGGQRSRMVLALKGACHSPVGRCQAQLMTPPQWHSSPSPVTLLFHTAHTTPAPGLEAVSLEICWRSSRGPQAHVGCWSASCLSPALVTRCCCRFLHASVLPWTLYSICKATLWFLLVRSNAIISPYYSGMNCPQHTLHSMVPMSTWPTLFVTPLLCLQTEIPTSVAGSRPPTICTCPPVPNSSE